MLEQQCVYHRDKVITNFCKANQCNMPLCPECVNDHYQIHFSRHDSPQIETLSSIHSNVLNIIRQLTGMFSENFEKLKAFYRRKAEQPPALQKLAEYRQKIQRLIDSYFEELELEVSLLQANESSYLEYQLLTTEQFISVKQAELDALTCKMEGSKGIKHIVNLYASDFINSTKNDSLRCNQFIDSLNYQTLEIDLNDSKIYDFSIELSKFIRIQNKELFIDTNRFSSEAKKQLHPLNRLTQSNSAYQFPHNKISSTHSSQIFTSPSPLFESKLSVNKINKQIPLFNSTSQLKTNQPENACMMPTRTHLFDVDANNQSENYVLAPKFHEQDRFFGLEGQQTVPQFSDQPGYSKEVLPAAYQNPVQYNQHEQSSLMLHNNLQRNTTFGINTSTQHNIPPSGNSLFRGYYQ